MRSDSRDWRAWSRRRGARMPAPGSAAERSLSKQLRRAAGEGWQARFSDSQPAVVEIDLHHATVIVMMTNCKESRRRAGFFFTLQMEAATHHYNRTSEICGANRCPQDLSCMRILKGIVFVSLRSFKLFNTTLRCFPTVPPSAVGLA